MTSSYPKLFNVNSKKALITQYITEQENIIIILNRSHKHMILSMFTGPVETR